MQEPVLADRKKEKKREYNIKYFEKNKESLLKYREKYYEANRDRLLKNKADYYARNREKLIKKAAKYREENAEKCLGFRKNYYERNRDIILAKDKAYKSKPDIKARDLINKREYAIRNREAIRKRRKEYEAEKRANSPAFRIRASMRSRLRHVLKGIRKAGTTEYLIGCTFQELVSHLENNFDLGMSWDNYGMHGWHIDHIVPISCFDLSDKAQQRACNHYTNLQPLWANQNWRKSAKAPPNFEVLKNNLLTAVRKSDNVPKSN